MKNNMPAQGWSAPGGKKIWIPIIVVIIIVVAVAVFYKPAPKETIKIGAILPLTGELASLGQGAKNGALLAFQELTADQQKKVQLLFEDDQFDPKNTISAFNKLISMDKVNVVICLASGPCNAIAPLAEEQQIPLIALASDPKIQKDKNFVVRLEIAPSEEAKILLDYIETKNYKSLASVVALQDGILAGYDNLLKDTGYSAIEVISEKVKPDEKDYRTVITKIISKQPDVIFVGLLPGFAGDFGKQARTLGYKGDFIGLNFLEGDETLLSAQGTLDGIIFTTRKEPRGWFIDAYKKQYGETFGPTSAGLYDSMMLIAKGVDTGKTSNLEIAKYLNAIKDYSGALGVFSSTDTHEFALPIMLKTIKNGKFVPYGE